MQSCYFTAHCDAFFFLFFFFFFFLLLHGWGNQLMFLFLFVCFSLVLFFPISLLGFLGMVSIPLLPRSSWLFPSIVFHSTEISLGSNCYGGSALLYYVIFIEHCCMYMILSWLRLGSWWGTMSVCFFPTPPDQSTGK